MALFRVPLDKLCKICRPTLSIPPASGIVAGIWYLGNQMSQSFRAGALRATVPLILPASYRIPQSWTVRLLCPSVVVRHGLLPTFASKYTRVPPHLAHLGLQVGVRHDVFFKRLCRGWWFLYALFHLSV